MSYQYRSQSVRELAQRISLDVDITADPRDLSVANTLQVKWAGVNRQVLNGLTRTMMAHIETVRFQYAWMNDYVTNDIVDGLGLALGCIPINMNASALEWENEHNSPPSWRPRYTSYSVRMDEAGHGVLSREGALAVGSYREQMPLDANPMSTIRFDFDVECTFDPATKKVSHQHVVGSDLVWVPLKGQVERFTALWGGIPKIPAQAEICRLNVGQRLAMSLFAVKGMAQEHAKFKSTRITQKQISEDAGLYNQGVKVIDGTSAQYPLHRSVQVLREKFESLSADCISQPTSENVSMLMNDR
jgi:hypothetical protein